MGNYTSSCFLVHSSNKARIIDSNGNLRQVKVSIKAAEVMIEEPGQVISPVDQLLRTHRVSPMRADDELLAGKAYMLFPVVRVHSKVKEEELAIVKAACHQKKGSLLQRRKKTSGAKVLPAVNEEAKGEVEGQVPVSGGTDTELSGIRLGNQKQWSPILEAISEVY
ncbi:hypothetical protein ACOSP7_000518 [Xanthoceras sorbifolium]|uniref:Uncharacterized protein n=1 Tax=Xanthoceras sorbifolium TaxID=99658 RepID=A0ABQ8IPM3_9ROSI|nr:hypothetical protein JRO89_XS01G0360600 [Xanthoceras sorbifolium]